MLHFFRPGFSLKVTIKIMVGISAIHLIENQTCTAPFTTSVFDPYIWPSTPILASLLECYVTPVCCAFRVFVHSDSIARAGRLWFFVLSDTAGRGKTWLFVSKLAHYKSNPVPQLGSFSLGLQGRRPSRLVPRVFPTERFQSVYYTSSTLNTHCRSASYKPL